jgi:crotonobetainyl-CoA:carnitine CoA-transferase CaiB-like acyl-CoA transferase
MPSPLTGVKVLDLSAYIAGPYGCTLLADMGAEVIKVEPPGGDTLRQFPSTLTKESRAFLGLNRSKKGIAVDLKRAEGLAALNRMVATADVLVHNFRPSVPARLGISYEQLRTVNPRLIYCSLTGYGDSGPLKDTAGYDQVLQSMTGICVFQGEGKEGPEIVFGSVVDYYAASLLAMAVTAALYHRERSGEGQHISVSLLASALAMQSARFVWAEDEGRDVKRDLRSGGVTGIHPTREGDLYLSANTPHFWRALCEMTGLADLATDPRFDTVRKRAAGANEVVPRLREALLKRTALEWEELFSQQVPCCAVRSIEDMFDHPQVLAENLVASFEHPGVGRYRGFTRAIKFSAAPASEPFAAPQLGQHSAEILERCGYSRDEVEKMLASGAIMTK